MADAKTFRGYGPEQGYDFLIDAVIKHDYARAAFISAHRKYSSTTGRKAIRETSATSSAMTTVWGSPIPSIPYIDSNVMCGRAGILEENGKWSNVTYMPCTAANNFIPEIPDKRIDIIYLCYPNNPTGTTLTKPELKKWVDYALANDTLILFDAAYEAFIQEDDVPHSKYKKKGRKNVPSNSAVSQRRQDSQECVAATP